jgi:hypothetical protein
MRYIKLEGNASDTQDDLAPSRIEQTLPIDDEDELPIDDEDELPIDDAPRGFVRTLPIDDAPRRFVQTLPDEDESPFHLLDDELPIDSDLVPIEIEDTYTALQREDLLAIQEEASASFARELCLFQHEDPDIMRNFFNSFFVDLKMSNFATFFEIFFANQKAAKKLAMIVGFIESDLILSSSKAKFEKLEAQMKRDYPELFFEADDEYCF